MEMGKKSINYKHKLSLTETNTYYLSLLALHVAEIVLVFVGVCARMCLSSLLL